MKRLIIIFLLFTFGCSDKSVKSPSVIDSATIINDEGDTVNVVIHPYVVHLEYHIKVVCWRSKYSIHFTKDNWHTFETLNEFFVIYGDQPVEQEIIDSYDACIAIAKKFPTYTSCITNNVGVHRHFLSAGKSPEQKPCCKPDKQVF